MAETLPNGTVIPQGADLINSNGVQAMRNLGASVDAQLGNRSLEYDSGWRDVSDSLYQDAVATLHVRRIGLEVHWRINGLTPGSASHVIYIPPTELAAPQLGITYPIQSAGGAAQLYLNAAGQLSRTRTAAPIPAGSWTAGMYSLPPGTPPPAASWNPPLVP